MVEMKGSFLDSENAPLVPADPLAAQQQPAAPPAYETVVEVQGEEIPTIETEEERTRITAAGVGSGVVGLLIGGPIGALILGFGGAYAAEKKDGVVGDTARAVGDVALSIKGKSKEIDEKHHVVDKSKELANKALEKAKQVDRDHKVLEKAKVFIIYSWTATVDFVRRHNLIERGVNGVGKGFCWVMEKVAGGSDRPEVATARTAEASAPPSQYDVTRK